MKLFNASNLLISKTVMPHEILAVKEKLKTNAISYAFSDTFDVFPYRCAIHMSST